jgi:hypothetical protein
VFDIQSSGRYICRYQNVNNAVMEFIQYIKPCRLWQITVDFITVDFSANQFFGDSVDLQLGIAKYQSQGRTVNI